MVSNFRKNNIQQFLETYNLNDASTIYLDILKDLCSDNVTTSNKLNLLLLLEEKASEWLSEAENIEQVVGSLQSLYKQVSQSKQHLLSRQILITSTVILITSSNPDTDPQLCDLLYKHVDYLLNIASTPGKNHPLLKLAACQCLQEIEEVFPGILSTESSVEFLLSACTTEHTVIFQSYASLLSLIMLNSSTKHEITENAAPPASPEYKVSPDHNPLSMYLVDILPLLSPATLHFVVSCLMSSPEWQVRLYTENFKTWFPVFFQSSYLPLNHLALCAYEKTSANDINALEHLMTSANHPLTPVSQRLVILHWIEAALKTKFRSVDVIPKGVCWAPNTYDGADSQERKLKVLGYILLNREDSHSRGTSNNLQQMLLHFLDSLTETGVRTTAILYRLLLHFYLQPNNLELENHICRVAVSFLRVSFNTIHYLLDFVASLQKSGKCSHSTEMILDYITNWMTDASKMEALHNQDTYLYGLHKIVVAPESAPEKIRCQLQFLQGLMSTSDAYRDWLRGHKIVNAATALLNRTDVMLLYSDLSELLFRFLNSETSDVDVRNRGKLSYSVISQNHSDLLLSQDTKGSIAIPHLLSEQSASTFPSAYPVHTLPTKVVSLKRYSRNEVATSEYDQITLENENGINMTKYYKDICNLSVPLQFELKLCSENNSDFRTLYALELMIQKDDSSSSSDVESIHRPVLSNDHVSQSSHKFTYQMKLSSVELPVLKFKVNFSTEDCHSYAEQLESQVIPLHELFLPLPVKQEQKSELFENLWTDISTSKCYKEYACLMNISSGNLQKLWNDFFVTTEVNENRVAILFVPSTHVLIRLISLEDSYVQIMFVTSNQDILPYIFNYLSDIKTLN